MELIAAAKAELERKGTKVTHSRLSILTGLEQRESDIRIEEGDVKS